MPHAYASQFRAMVVDQVGSGRSFAEVAEAVGVPLSTVFRRVTTTCGTVDQAVATRS